VDVGEPLIDPWLAPKDQRGSDRAFLSPFDWTPGGHDAHRLLPATRIQVVVAAIATWTLIPFAGIPAHDPDWVLVDGIWQHVAVVNKPLGRALYIEGVVVK
jgi:hypothetical protein